MPPEEIEQWRAVMEADDEETNGPFKVFPANMDAVILFLGLTTYNAWSRAGMMGSPTNLDIHMVRHVLALKGHGDDFTLFDQIMTIGAAAADALCDRHFRNQ